MVYSNKEEVVVKAKEIIATTEQANVDNYIALIKKDKSEGEEVHLVDHFKDVYSCQKRHLDTVALKF